MLTQCASNPRVQPNELKVAAHQFQPAIRSELFVTELDRKLSLDRPPQPPYLQPHLWGLSCRLSCVAAVLQMTRQRPFFFDQIVESTRIIFGSRLDREKPAGLCESRRTGMIRGGFNQLEYCILPDYVVTSDRAEHNAV